MTLQIARAELPVGHVSGVLVGVLAELVQRRGIDPGRLLGRAFEPSQRIPLAEFQRLLLRAVELTEEPALGLEFGLQASEASFGLFSPLVSHTTTLRHALQLVMQFHPLLIDDTHLQLQEHVDRAQVLCTLPRGPAILSELVVAGLVRALRSFGCTPSELYLVSFTHARPAHHAAYRRAYGGAERFGGVFTGVEFARALLDRPHLHRQPELEQLLREQAERGLKSLTRTSCTDRLRAMVLRSGVELDMERAARELGLSVRSLRRRLLDEGTSYRALTQAVLQESACAMLRSPERTLQEVAQALGFADVMTFHHTFKRWTKQTPTEYRQSQ